MERMSMEYMNLPLEFKVQIDLIMDVLTELEGIEKIYLFGSCGRENPKLNSDIDLAIIFNKTMNL